jgi:hypothetical protein
MPWSISACVSSHSSGWNTALQQGSACCTQILYRKPFSSMRYGVLMPLSISAYVFSNPSDWNTALPQESACCTEWLFMKPFSPVRDRVLHTLVHLCVCFPESIRLKHWVPSKVSGTPRRHDGALSAPHKGDGLRIRPCSTMYSSSMQQTCVLLCNGVNFELCAGTMAPSVRPTEVMGSASGPAANLQ